MTDKEFIEKISNVVNEAAGHLHIHTIVGILECVKTEVLSTVTVGKLISTGMLKPPCNHRWEPQSPNHRHCRICNTTESLPC